MSKTEMSYKPELYSCEFTFVKKGNSNGTTGETESLTVSCESSLGIDEEEGCFFVLRSDCGWSINDVSELQEIIDRITKVIKHEAK
jgi:hypothetical protein